MISSSSRECGEYIQWLAQKEQLFTSWVVYKGLILSLDIHKWHQHNSIFTERRRRKKEQTQRGGEWGKQVQKWVELAFAGFFFSQDFRAERKILSPRKRKKRASTTHLTAKLLCYLIIPLREPVRSLPGRWLCSLWYANVPVRLKKNKKYLQVSWV